MKTSRLHEAGIDFQISRIAIKEFREQVKLRRLISFEELTTQYLAQGLSRRRLLTDIGKGLVQLKPTTKQVNASFRTLKQIQNVNRQFYHPSNRSYDETVIRYLTQLDNLVRPHHRVLHGLTYERGHPFWIDHLPPIEHGCRCFIESILRRNATLSPDAVDTGGIQNTLNTGIDGMLDYMTASNSNLIGRYIGIGGDNQKVIDGIRKSIEVLQTARTRALLVEILRKSNVSLSSSAALIALTQDQADIVRGNIANSKEVYHNALLRANSQDKGIALLGSLGFLQYDVDNISGRSGQIIGSFTDRSIRQIASTGILEHTVIADFEGNQALTVHSPSISEYNGLIIVSAGATVALNE
jgi:hypothetical protein